MFEVYRLFDWMGRLLYVGHSQSAAGRLRSHQTGTTWGSSIATITIEQFETREAAERAENLAIRTESPQHNKRVTLHSKKQAGFKTSKISVRLPTALKTSLAVIAKADDRKLSEFVWLLLEDAVAARRVDAARRAPRRVSPSHMTARTAKSVRPSRKAKP